MRLSPDPGSPSADGRHGSPWHAVGAAVVTALALSGVGLIVVAVDAGSPHPPQPAAEAAAPPDAEPTGMATSAALDEADLPLADSWSEPPGMARSEPATITIATVKIRAKVLPLGLNPDRTLQVPPLEQAQLAGWYRFGPSPGEVGNSVIAGHVDSATTGPAVFFRLGALRPGDAIEVARADGTVARFTVDRVASYPKSEFPTELVYGDTDRAQLRLVTCGGRFDRQRHTYVNNTIVFATLLW